jgi:hypothetical protein
MVQNKENLTMYFLVYETTNLINGKVYVGSHKTEDLNDGYLGSGKNLKRAIRKYGAENFSRRIVRSCESSEEMYELEAKIVNEEFILRKDTYNIVKGGCGGFDFINSTRTSYNLPGPGIHAGHITTKSAAVKKFIDSNVKCRNCGAPISYETRRNGSHGKKKTYCSISCGSTFLNRNSLSYLNRKHALDNSLKFYEGKPCKTCKGTLRYTSSGICKQRDNHNKL